MTPIALTRWYVLAVQVAFGLARCRVRYARIIVAVLIAIPLLAIAIVLELVRLIAAV